MSAEAMRDYLSSQREAEKSRLYNTYCMEHVLLEEKHKVNSRGST